MIKFNFDSSKFEKKIQAIGKDSDDVAEEIVKELGSLIKTNARHYVPVDTGDLKASIDLDIKSSTEATVGSALDYAAEVEFGTRRKRPQPYLMPAKYDAEAAADRVMKRVVSKYVD